MKPNTLLFLYRAAAEPKVRDQKMKPEFGDISFLCSRYDIWSAIIKTLGVWRKQRSENIKSLFVTFAYCE